MTIGFLSDYTAGDTEIAGGKGANLGELIRHGFPIPPGFVIGADEYATVLATVRRDADPDATREAIRAWEPDDSFMSRIADCHARLQARRPVSIVYAVRSSATAEDLPDASFAGQHATYYYVTIDEAPRMIRACWLSLWSPEAIAYRDTHGIAHRDVRMAVVVQEMILSDVSGVTFTANPLTGEPGVVVTDATWGMGAAIVDGRVTPDHYVMARDTRTVTGRRIANKTLMVSTRRNPGASDRMVPVPQNRQSAPCLRDDDVVRIADWACRAEAHFGAPQDIEWAIADGQFYLLQSRNITTLEDVDDVIETRKLVLFKAFAENFTEPLLPMTVDTLNTVTPTPFYKGRVYQEIGILRVLLPLRVTDTEAVELLSWSSPDNFRLRINWFMLPVSLLIWAMMYLSLGVSQARSRRMPDDFMETFREHVAAIDADDSLSPAEAIAKLFFGLRPFHPIGLQVMPMNVTSVLRYFSLMGAVRVLLSHWLPDLPRDAASLLCSGSVGVKSTEMGREIFALSRIARRDAKVAALFRQYPADELLSALRRSDAAREFVVALERFLAIHGHRALKEFELASPRFDEDPAPVLAMIRNYLGSSSDPDEMERRTNERRTALLTDIHERLQQRLFERWLPWRRNLIDYLAERARHFTKLRENTRFYHIMGWKLARGKILRAEAQLIQAGALRVRGDVFYLHWNEVRALLSGRLGWRDIEPVIRARRMTTLKWSKQDPPRALNIEMPARRRAASAGELHGQGASPGQYEGIARVIIDPRVNAELVPGEILVAPYTDPAWTPLFLTARAAVVGVGSYLSHAGTIAREYGLPCVVDVENCTGRIRTGDRLLVDGTAGVVQILRNDTAPGADEAPARQMTGGSNPR